MTNFALGIDLGSSHSNVGVWKNGSVEIVANEEGGRSTHSCVAFTANDILVGDAAYLQKYRNPRNTVSCIKQLLGKNYSDEFKSKQITKDSQGNLNLQVSYKKKDQLFSPSKVASMIVKKLNGAADAFLGEKAKSAVLTVPVQFDDQQRKAVREAASLAGLEVLKLLEEPVAVAIAYGLDNLKKTNANAKGAQQESTPKKVLVFDMGASGARATLLTIRSGLVEVGKSSYSDEIGGTAFNQLLLDHCAKQFKRKTDDDLTTNESSIIKLLEACEHAKCALSASPKTDIDLHDLFEGQDFSTSITKARFEGLIGAKLRQSMKLIQDALEGTGKEEISDVLLAGGCCNIPRLRLLVSNFFGATKIRRTEFQLVELVAYGAAVQASLDVQHKETKLDQAKVDVTPLSLGLKSWDGRMVTILDRHTPVPCSASRVFSTSEDNQSALFVQVYEGERLQAAENRLVGRFQITGIPKALRAQPRITVCFEVDAKGALRVTAKDTTGDRISTLEVKGGVGNKLNEKEIEDSVSAAQAKRFEDLAFVGCADARLLLQDYIASKEKNVADASYPEGTLNKLRELCANMTDKIKNAGDAMDRPTEEKLLEILEEGKEREKIIQEEALDEEAEGEDDLDGDESDDLD